MSGKYSRSYFDSNRPHTLRILYVCYLPVRILPSPPLPRPSIVPAGPKVSESPSGRVGRVGSRLLALVLREQVPVPEGDEVELREKQVREVPHGCPVSSRQLWVGVSSPGPDGVPRELPF